MSILTKLSVKHVRLMSFSSPYQVVDEVGEGPDHRNADERYVEQYYV